MVSGKTTVTVSMVNYPDPDVYEVDSATDVFISGGGVLTIVHARGATFDPIETHHIAPHAWATIDVVVNEEPLRPPPADPGRYSERGNTPRTSFKHRRWFR